VISPCVKIATKKGTHEERRGGGNRKTLKKKTWMRRVWGGRGRKNSERKGKGGNHRRTERIKRRLAGKEGGKSTKGDVFPGGTVSFGKSVKKKGGKQGRYVTTKVEKMGETRRSDGGGRRDQKLSLRKSGNSRRFNREKKSARPIRQNKEGKASWTASGGTVKKKVVGHLSQTQTKRRKKKINAKNRGKEKSLTTKTDLEKKYS